MVIRDDVGLVVVAMSKKISISLGSLEAEAKAMEVAIQLQLIFGSDKLSLRLIPFSYTMPFKGTMQLPLPLRM